MSVHIVVRFEKFVCMYVYVCDSGVRTKVYVYAFLCE